MYIASLSVCVCVCVCIHACNLLFYTNHRQYGFTCCGDVCPFDAKICSGVNHGREVEFEPMDFDTKGLDGFGFGLGALRVGVPATLSKDDIVCVFEYPFGCFVLVLMCVRFHMIYSFSCAHVCV